MVRIASSILLVFLHLFSTSHASSPVTTESELLGLAAKAGQPFCLRACFSSEVTAHLAASKRLLAAAMKLRREISWRVYRMDDSTFAYSYPAVSEPGATQSRMPPLARGLDYVSAGHIHWDRVHHFSPQDWNWVTGNRKPLFLVSSDGILRRALPRRIRALARSGGLATRPAVEFGGERVAVVEQRLAIASSSSAGTNARP